MMELDAIRQKIDRTDRRMQELFIERMGLSGQVAAEKLRTGGAVYAPEREREVMDALAGGAGDAFAPECRAFFRQLMGISRACQYARMAGQAEIPQKLPSGEGEAVLHFYCRNGGEELAAFLETALMAGLSIREIHMGGTEGGEAERDRLRRDAADPGADALSAEGTQDAFSGTACAGEPGRFCRIRLAGDFSSDLARGAVLQLLEEGEAAAVE